MRTSLLDPQEFSRFKKIAARLQSDNPHERAVAADMGTQVLRAHNLCWADVLRLPEPERRHEPPPPPPRGMTWQETARRLLRNFHALSWKEEDFIHNILDRQRLTERQEIWLRAIADRVLGRDR